MLSKLHEKRAAHRETKLAELQDKVEQIERVKFLGVTSKAYGSIVGDPAFGNVDSDVIYAFLIKYKDRHRELYHGKKDDEFISALLDWIEM